MKNQHIAYVCERCFGDNLISMVTVNNLVRNGYQVDVYGNYVYALRDWFPWATIFPGITLETQHTLAKYPVVFHMYDNDIAQAVAKWHANSVAFSKSSLYHAKISMVDIQVALCEQELGLSNVVRTNGLLPLAGLVARKHKQRVIIHPTSSLERKNWPKEKFIRLAQLLTNDGYEPNFIVSPQERPQWLDVLDRGILLPEFSSLSALASFVYESGWFIGNDSGIGHLASNLGVPTVSIILRKGVARQWRPTWSRGEVVLSPTWLNPRPLKEKLWKHFITVNAVWGAFKKLKIKN